METKQIESDTGTGTCAVNEKEYRYFLCADYEWNLRGHFRALEMMLERIKGCGPYNLRVVRKFTNLKDVDVYFLEDGRTRKYVSDVLRQRCPELVSFKRKYRALYRKIDSGGALELYRVYKTQWNDATDMLEISLIYNLDFDEDPEFIKRLNTNQN